MARDLDGREVMLPPGLPGAWSAVLVAFRRQQQTLAEPNRFVAIARDYAGLPAYEDEDTAPA